MTTTTGAAPMSAAEVVDTLERCQAYVDDAACFPAQFKPGVVKRDQRQYIEARAVVSAMAEREAELVAERDGFKLAWWDIVEMLGGKKLPDISNAQYHASVLAPKIRDLIAMSAERDALRAEVEALRALVSEWNGEAANLERAGVNAPYYDKGKASGFRKCADNLRTALARAEAGR